jgi:hypothetical protein
MALYESKLWQDHPPVRRKHVTFFHAAVTHDRMAHSRSWRPSAQDNDD